MGCLVVFSKRSYLGLCALGHGTTIGNPNCGQRVADDHARVPESAGWSFCCVRSTSPKTRGAVQHAVRACSASLHGAGLVSSDVSAPRPNLLGGRGVSWSSTVSCASSPFCCRLTTPGTGPPHSKTASSIWEGFLPKTRWYALYPLSLIFDALAWFTASQSSSKSVHVCASEPSCVVLSQSSFQSLPARSFLPFLHGASRRVTSSRVPSLSTFSASMPRA